MKLGKVIFGYGSEKLLGLKRVRLPRKKKKDLQKRWDNYKYFIKLIPYKNK